MKAVGCFYPPSQLTTDLSVDKCANTSLIGVKDMRYAMARCRIQAEADNRGRLVASKPLAKSETEGEDG
jgi:hypothetical protein